MEEGPKKMDKRFEEQEVPFLIWQHLRYRGRNAKSVGNGGDALRCVGALTICVKPTELVAGEVNLPQLPS